MRYLTGVCVILLALAALGIVDARQDEGDAKRTITAAAHTRDSLKAELAQALLRVPYVTDTVRIVSSSTKTLADSLRAAKWDTVLVERFIWRVDTLRQQCLACAALLDTIQTRYANEKRATDSYISLLQREVKEAKRTHWYQRFSVGVGYGFTKIGSELHAGPQVQFQIRGWP